MIATPSMVRKLVATLVTALMLLAQPCLGGEPTTIETGGFSVTFGETWHVSTDHYGTILGSIRGEEPPFIVIYYADQPMTADPAKSAMFEHMKQSSITDIIGDSARKVFDESQWHRHDTVHRPDGMTEEQLDSEASGRKDDGTAITVCSFMRFYHGAPHAELYLAFVMTKPCDEARAEFDSFERSIVWK
jgi:hypothetical protein